MVRASGRLLDNHPLDWMSMVASRMVISSRSMVMWSGHPRKTTAWTGVVGDVRVPVITLREFPLYLVLNQDKSMEVRHYGFPGGKGIVAFHANKKCWSNLPHIKAGHIVALGYVDIVWDLNVEGAWEFNQGVHRIASKEPTYATPKGWSLTRSMWILPEPIEADGSLGLWYHDVPVPESLEGMTRRHIDGRGSLIPAHHWRRCKWYMEAGPCPWCSPNDKELRT